MQDSPVKHHPEFGLTLLELGYTRPPGGPRGVASIANWRSLALRTRHPRASSRVFVIRHLDFLGHSTFACQAVASAKAGASSLILLHMIFTKHEIGAQLQNPEREAEMLPDVTLYLSRPPARESFRSSLSTRRLVEP